MNCADHGEKVHALLRRRLTRKTAQRMEGPGGHSDSKQKKRSHGGEETERKYRPSMTQRLERDGETRTAGRPEAESVRAPAGRDTKERQAQDIRKATLCPQRRGCSVLRGESIRERGRTLTLDGELKKRRATDLRRSRMEGSRGQPRPFRTKQTDTANKAKLKASPGKSPATWLSRKKS